MRTWFYKHPNFPLVFFGLMFIMMSGFAGHRAHNGQWGWAALDGVAAVVFCIQAQKWWERT